MTRLSDLPADLGPLEVLIDRVAERLRNPDDHQQIAVRQAGQCRIEGTQDVGLDIGADCDAAQA